MKSRSRDPDAMDFGLYALIDIETNGAATPALAGRWVCGLSLDEIEAWLGSGGETTESEAA